MDDLLGAFSSNLFVSDQNSTRSEHPRFACYKQKESKSSQSERRKKFLEAQKQKRFDFVNHARKLATNEHVLEDQDEEDNNFDEEMDCDIRPARSRRLYKDQLMMSEWMVEVPEDLALNWLLVLCPIGKRCLVVASGGKTTSYSRTGYRLNTFPSSLPGGSRKEMAEENRGYSLLDCFFCEKEKVFYVLDMVCWNGHPLYDSETEFRFYWLHTKFKEECPKAIEVTPANPYKFIPLPSYACDANTLKNVLSSPMPFSCELDGLLFFHKRVHYIPKTVPLCCWLKGYMVTEMLNIEVPESLCTGRPVDYTTMKELVPKAFEKSEKRKEKEANSMQFEEND